MEPETLPIENVLLGLAVLSLIPIAIFALWADYFGRHMNQLSIKNSKFNREPEIEKVRLGSLFVILFQCTLFIGSADIESAFPILTSGLFVLVISLQMFIQYQTEKSLFAKHQSSPNQFRFAAKIGFSWMAGAGLYLAILALNIKLASTLAEKLHLSPLASTGFLFCGGLLGAVIGLITNFALSPIYLQIMFSPQPIPDSQLKSQLEQYFQKVKLPSPRFWKIGENGLKFSDLILSGYPNGRGPFRPTLFISQMVIESLQPNEIEALILNQVSHITLKHLSKRFIYSLALILGTAGASILAMLIGQLVLSTQMAVNFLGPLVAIFSFFSALRHLAIQAKDFEFQADIHTIKNFGISLEALINALQKMDNANLPKLPNNVHPLIKNHPETEARIQKLRSYFKQEEPTIEDNDDSQFA